VPPENQKRVKKKTRLTLTNKVDIVYRMMVEYEKALDVAKLYNISVARVSQIVKQVKDKKDVFVEAYQQRVDKEEKKQSIREVVEQMIK